ncbi:MAG: site-specific integrase [Candidatus Omnitrophota bacterium]
MKGVYKRGDVYYISYSLNGNRVQRAVSTDRKLAEAVLQKRKVEIAEGKHLDIKKTLKVKFEDFVDEYLEVHCKPNNKSWRKSDYPNLNGLKKYFGSKCLHEITPEDIERYRAERIKEVTKSTVNRVLNCLSSLYNRGIEWGKVISNPVSKVKLFKVPEKRIRYLEKEEINRLLANCCEHLKPIVIVALHTGMRKGEILGLRWHDIDIKRGIIHLLDTKNGEKREVPMNEVVQKTIINVLKNPESQYVFCKEDNKSYGNVRKSFSTACKKADITNFRFHDLRHTFASQLVMNGVDLNTVRELLGHKSIEMTLRYSHLSPDHKKRAVDLLSKKIALETPENGYKIVTGAKNAKVTPKHNFHNSLELNQF